MFAILEDEINNSKNLDKKKINSKQTLFEIFTFINKLILKLIPFTCVIKKKLRDANYKNKDNYIQNLSRN